MALGKSSILKLAGTFKAREVHVPELADPSGDDVVLVRGMTLKEFELSQSYADDGMATATVMSQCIVDDQGIRVFSKGDVPMLAELPIAVTKLINKAIMEASGFGDEGDTVAEKADKAIADAEGNSDATPADGTSSS